jgi:hypothetical protein
MQPTADLISMQLRELKRPWKLITLLVGIALLIIGAKFIKAPDWDIPISFIMAILAYLFAPFCLRIVLERRWRLLPIMLFLTWFTVDGSYWLYWHSQDPLALALMRSSNFIASLSLFGFCGLVWLFNGPVRVMPAAIRAQLSSQKSSPQ